MNQQEKARQIVCRACRAGKGEACRDLRPPLRRRRIKTVHAIRIADVKAKEAR